MGGVNAFAGFLRGAMGELRLVFIDFVHGMSPLVEGLFWTEIFIAFAPSF